MSKSETQKVLLNPYEQQDEDTQGNAKIGNSKKWQN
jgi:hypothetical protein